MLIVWLRRGGAPQALLADSVARLGARGPYVAAKRGAEAVRYGPHGDVLLVRYYGGAGSQQLPADLLHLERAERHESGGGLPAGNEGCGAG